MTTPIELPLKTWFDALERRGARRSPTGLDFVIADRLDALNLGAWDEVTRHRGLQSSSGFLRALERARTPGLTHKYALGYRHDRAVLAMSMQALEVSVDRLRPATTAGLIEGLDTASLERAVKQRVLVCGNVFSCGFDGAVWTDDLDDELATRAVGEVLYRVRRAEKLHGQTNLVAVKDLTEAQAAKTKALEDLSYRLMRAGPTMELELSPTWKTHDDYLGGMVSKYRSAVKRRVFAPIVEGGGRVETLTAAHVECHAARLHQLHLEVQDAAAVRPATVGPWYWQAMAELEGCVIKAVLRGDEVLGFLVVLVDHDTAHAAQIGFSRDAAKTLPLYLRLLHSAVEVALERGCRRVSLGRTALEPKARMGARPVETMLWVRHRVPLVNALAGGLVDWVQPESAPAIDPFRREVG